MGLIFVSCLVFLRVCIAAGSNVPSEFPLNPLLLNFSQTLRDTPFSKELIAASADATSCSSPGYIWSLARISEIGNSAYEFLFNNYITIMPFIYKLYIDKSEDGEYFGTSGSLTEELVQRHDLAANFWKSDNVSTENVLLLGAHGAMLKDQAKLIPTIEFMYPSMTDNRVNEFFGQIQDIINGIPRGSENPLLTLNAVAAPGGDVFGTGEIFPASIVMGDGLIDKLADMGLGVNGPDFVHAHECAHQVQFDLGVYDASVPASPIDTRNKELMADAFSAYFLSHDKGEDMNMSQILDLHMTAFTVGDCNFESKGHHGTPSQRRCASMWGASKAMGKSDIIDPATLREHFDNALHEIVSLSSEICPVPVENNPTECPDDFGPISVHIQLDGFAAETSWEIKSTDGTTYASIAYSAADDFNLVTEVVCIDPEKEYSFNIRDTYGDGIIDGIYKIFNGTVNEGETGVILVEGHTSLFSVKNVPFTVSLCPGMMPITILIQLDEFAHETSWSITGAADEVEYESVAYAHEDKYTNVSQLVCLHLEKDYTFSIRDSYGDGILNGYYKAFNGTNIDDEGALLFEGDGAFEEGTDVTFSPSLCPNRIPITITLQLDEYPFETSWAIKTAEDDVEFASEWYSPDDEFSIVSDIVCVQPGELYTFSILDNYGDGIIGGYYKIFRGKSEDEDQLLLEGDGSFGDATSVDFLP